MEVQKKLISIDMGINNYHLPVVKKNTYNENRKFKLDWN